ncbi:MAG: hypothetical protein ABIQ74_14555 [Chitinophagales bacterium]
MIPPGFVAIISEVIEDNEILKGDKVTAIATGPMIGINLPMIIIMPV